MSRSRTPDAPPVLSPLEHEIQVLGERSIALAASIDHFEQERVDLAAEREDLRSRAARGDDVGRDLERVRQGLAGLEERYADQRAVRDQVNSQLVAKQTEFASLQRQRSIDEMLAEAEQMRDDLNALGRQYEASWKRLSDHLFEIQRASGRAPTWIEDARVEINNSEITFPMFYSGNALIVLPVIGQKRQF